jgi:hypothetical protein
MLAPSGDPLPRSIHYPSPDEGVKPAASSAVAPRRRVQNGYADGQSKEGKIWAAVASAVTLMLAGAGTFTAGGPAVAGQ